MLWHTHLDRCGQPTDPDVVTCSSDDKSTKNHPSYHQRGPHNDRSQAGRRLAKVQHPLEPTVSEFNVKAPRTTGEDRTTTNNSACGAKVGQVPPHGLEPPVHHRAQCKSTKNQSSRHQRGPQRRVPQIRERDSFFCLLLP